MMSSATKKYIEYAPLVVSRLRQANVSNLDKPILLDVREKDEIC